MKDIAEELAERIAEAEEKDLPMLSIVLLKRYLRLRPDSDYRWFLYAENLRVIGRKSEAEEILRRLPDPPHPRTYLRRLSLGTLFQEQGRFAEAEYQYREALRLAPESTVPYVYLANLLNHLERFAESLEILREGRTAEGDRDEVLANMGVAYRALDNLSEAAACYRAALEIDPQYDGAKSALEDVEQALRAAKE